MRIQFDIYYSVILSFPTLKTEGCRLALPGQHTTASLLSL